MDKFAIGVDLGGTKIAFALIDERGKPVLEHRTNTLPNEGQKAVLDRVAAGIKLLIDQSDHPIAGIGIGSPGHIVYEEGIVRNAVNLGWGEVPLRQEISNRLNLDLPVWIDKDATAAALGEWYFGAARDYEDFVYLSIGTGLGGGAVSAGKLLRGAAAYAMSIGHISLDRHGRICTCGKRGCPEMYVSGIGLKKSVELHRTDFPESPISKSGSPTTTDIITAIQVNDPLALAIWDEAIDWLATVAACCAGILNPRLFVIGGGLGHATAHLLLQPLAEKFRNRTLPATHKQVEFTQSQLTISAIGPACLVWHTVRNPEDT